MNISDLTPQKLKRATLIKEKLDDLNKELRRLLDGITTDGVISEKKRTMTAAVKRKMRLRSGRAGRSLGGRIRDLS